MRKLITRGLPVALALGAVLCGPAAAAYADTPTDGPGKSLGHAKPAQGKANGHTPAPVEPPPAPATYDRTASVQWSHWVGPSYPGRVNAYCDPGDVVVENAAVMSVAPIPGAHIMAGPIPLWNDAGSAMIGYGMTFVTDDGQSSTQIDTGIITITCSDVSA